ncbi:hypothetical protein ACIBI4_04825 [Streptomyces sp. NPDC050418]|uniref:hypothetical protein n=1 Tax=Streptomyces sp. NPDC050418 TaxID=3365612 RepID=UPI0037A70CB4
MSLAAQVLPLVGVAVGAVVSLAVSAINERTRWRRQQSVRWDERRLNAYAEYAHAVKELSSHYKALAIARGLTSGYTPLEETDDLLRELTAAEVRRSALAETLWLLGDVDSNTAAVKLNHALWHLEWLARGVPTAGVATWDEAYLEFRQARQDFVQAARTDLGVRGGRIAHNVPWPPRWRPADDSGASGS